MRAAQRGMSLIFALLALVALSMGAVALIRSVDTSGMVLGNLGFKQDATASAERATEAAIVFLQGVPDRTNNSSNDNGGGSGYYASSTDTLDPTGQSGESTRVLVDWEADGCKYANEATSAQCTLGARSLAADGGQRSDYVIFRLCQQTGAIADGNPCITPADASSGSSTKRGKLDYGDYARFVGSPDAYYRIIVRSVGARNTVSYTETIIHF
jgi:type IV pilus assembly protein PilX